MRFRIFLFEVFGVLALANFLQVPLGAADLESVKEQIIAHARTVTAEDYAYTRMVRSESFEGAKKEEKITVERWDPTQVFEQRWKLISINGQTPTEGQSQNYRKDSPKRRAAYYGRVAGYFDKPATNGVDEKGRNVFRFASLPKDSVMVNDTDLSGNSSAELLVNSSGAVPFVEEVRFRSTKPTRVKLVAKIERFETTTHYRLMQNGKPVPSELVSEMSGSMLGAEGRIITKITYSDFRATAN